MEELENPVAFRLGEAIRIREERLVELREERKKYKGTLHVRLGQISIERAKLEVELEVLKEVMGG